jgi:hypothetical protein
VHTVVRINVDVVGALCGGAVLCAVLRRRGAPRATESASNLRLLAHAE